jgi:hypothetical protein
MKGRVLLFDINDINTTSSLTSPHQSIRQTAQDNYLKSQHKRQKEYDKHLEKIADSYKNGDIVGIAINKVDRTNCDPKIMPCMIEKRSDNPDIPMYHLISPYGRLSISFPVHQLIPMSGIQPTLLKTAKFKDSETITFVQASKLFARGNPCAGLPNPNFRNQEFFVKNQELIRRLFLENQEKNQEVFSMKWRVK